MQDEIKIGREIEIRNSAVCAMILEIGKSLDKGPQPLLYKEARQRHQVERISRSGCEIYESWLSQSLGFHSLQLDPGFHQHHPLLRHYSYAITPTHGVDYVTD